MAVAVRDKGNTGYDMIWMLRNALRRMKAFRDAASARGLKKKFRHCGVGVHLNGKSRIRGCRFVWIGNNVHIGENAFIRAEGGLEIGDNTHISRNVVIYTINHRFRDSCCLPYDDEVMKKPVRIGRNVWIGMNVCIAPGTRIGDGAIVGMGTVVAGEVPPLAIIGSERWRVLGMRDPAHYRRLDDACAFGGVAGAPSGIGQGASDDDCALKNAAADDE